MMSRSQAYLEQILRSIDRITTYAAEGSRAFFESPLPQDAIVHNLELIGASVKELPADWLGRYPHIPWTAIARMRDRSAHPVRAAGCLRLGGTGKQMLIPERFPVLLVDAGAALMATFRS